MNAPLARPTAGDAWGALAATAILLPQAMAFGVTLFTASGADAASGAYAGLVTTAALCLLSGLFGGAPGVISAPTGPALVLLGSAAAALSAAGLRGSDLLLGIAAVVMAAGALQFAIGLAGGGKLVKYIPSSVISGFMTGSAILMIKSQVKALGAHGLDAAWSGWRWLPAAVALVTIVGVKLAPRLLPRLPGPIAGLALGTLAFHALVALHGGPPPAAWLIGRLAGFRTDSLGLPLDGLAALPWTLILPSAAALAVLAALNTLLAAVIADASTGLRHDARRALMGGGLGLVASALAGGIGGSGTTGATVIAVHSGGTRWVAALIGALFLLLTAFAGDAGRVLPIGALAGVIIAVALDIADRDILAWARRGGTRQEAMIAVLVTVITVGYDLITAIGAGVAIAILLFIREQVSAPIVARRSTAREVRSLRARPESERLLIEQHGERIVLFELRGNLFFGTADRLMDELGAALAGPNWVVLHLRKVTAIDLTAIKLLQQIANRLQDAGGELVFCELHAEAGIGESFEDALRAVSDRLAKRPVRTFNGRDEALEYAEDALLDALQHAHAHGDSRVAFAANAIARHLSPAQVANLEARLTTQTLAAGATLFAEGEPGEELYIVIRGRVEILLRTSAHHHKRLAVYGAGSFFGELALLKRGPRAGLAVATQDSELLALSRETFERLKQDDPALAIALLTALCETLVNIQRWSTRELQRLSEW
ncbi:MAG: SLC26A/SulP transporter family protein [Gammaproteobacteria bacterium]